MAAPRSSGRANTEQLLYILMETTVAGVRDDGPDLSARQLSVFLKVYLEQGTEHTVRGLAAELNVVKPVITKALNRLGELGFTKRAVDPMDRRSILVRRTPAGSAHLRGLGSYLVAASKQTKK